MPGEPDFRSVGDPARQFHSVGHVPHPHRAVVVPETIRRPSRRYRHRLNPAGVAFQSAFQAAAGQVARWQPRGRECCTCPGSSTPRPVPVPARAAAGDQPPRHPPHRPRRHDQPPPPRRRPGCRRNPAGRAGGARAGADREPVGGRGVAPQRAEHRRVDRRRPLLARDHRLRAAAPDHGRAARPADPVRRRLAGPGGMRGGLPAREGDRRSRGSSRPPWAARAGRTRSGRVAARSPRSSVEREPRRAPAAVREPGVPLRRRRDAVDPGGGWSGWRRRRPRR